MSTFRLDSIAQLARELNFAPQDVRAAQVDSAEQLLNLIDPAKAYPFDFVIFRITGYRPKTGGEALLTGIALQHDLGLLIERVSDSLNLPTSAVSQPVLSIDDVCERFNVTSKTIQRWRRRALVGRRFVFPDGKRRIGFLLGSVEHFLVRHGEQLAAMANFSEMDLDEQAQILRHARRLAVDCGCCTADITRRLARMTRRSRLTILHTLRKHDQDHPDQAILPLAAADVSESDRLLILRGAKRGTHFGELARRLDRPRATIHRVLLDDRIDRLCRRKVRLCDDSLFHQKNALQVVDALLHQEELSDEPARDELRVPRDLPPYLQDLYRTPLLTKGRERALFLKFNLHKYRFMQARRKLDPEMAGWRDLTALERHLTAASQTKNAIVQANLRLVVSVARRHLRPSVNLLDLISDGNITLMRAVEGFDVARGNRFSTYATLALMKGFARSVPQMQAAERRATSIDEQILEALPDRRQSLAGTRMLARDEVRSLLSRLSDRERDVLSAHFGLESDAIPATHEQVGHRLGLSKERVRQIEQTALAKMRAMGDDALA